MEPLEHLDPYKSGGLFAGQLGVTSPFSVKKKIIQNSDLFVERIIQKINENKVINKIEKVFKMKKILAQTIQIEMPYVFYNLDLKNIVDDINGSFSLEKMLQEVADVFREILYEKYDLKDIFDQISIKIGMNFSFHVASIIYGGIGEIFEQIFERTVFPQDYDDFKEHPAEYWSNANDEQKKLIYALNYLAKKYQIYWRDLHEDNIMIRPSTGEYVIADIGAFFGLGGSSSTSSSSLSSTEPELRERMVRIRIK